MKIVPAVAIAVLAGALLPVAGVAEAAVAAQAAPAGFEVECLDIQPPQTFTTADVGPAAIPLEAPVATLVEPTYDWRSAVELAYAEVGSSRPTGWSQAGECTMSAQRWVLAGGGAWTGGGTVLGNYVGATRHSVGEAVPGDVIQYHWAAAEGEWVDGVHTVLITGVNADGTFKIVESNNPGGSGLVTADDSWVPAPPAGFVAAVWRF